jgi:hypothetical protein
MQCHSPRVIIPYRPLNFDMLGSPRKCSCYGCASASHERRVCRLNFVGAGLICCVDHVQLDYPESVNIDVRALNAGGTTQPMVSVGDESGV